MKAVWRSVVFAALGVIRSVAESAAPVVPPVDAGVSGIGVRGLLVHAGGDEWVVFDQDLLRPALWFHAPQGTPQVPVGAAINLTPALPGVGMIPDDLLKDPRPAPPGEPVRGGLEVTGRQFLGYQPAAPGGVLTYQIGGMKVREWYQADRENLRRHLTVESGGEILFLLAAGDFQAAKPGGFISEKLHVSSDHASLTLENFGGMLIGRLAASNEERQVSLGYSAGKPAAPAPAAWLGMGSHLPKPDSSMVPLHRSLSNAVPTAELGKELVTRVGCIACHSIDGTKVGRSGPTFKGLYDSEVRFNEGAPRKADDAYLTEAILEPGKFLVAGYPLGMGTYAGILGEPELQSIVLYIKSLK